MSANIYEKLRLEKSPMNIEVDKKLKKALTQTQLADALNISQQSVSKVERGISPSLDTVKAYHKYFGVPYSTLLGESDALTESNVNLNMELRLTDESIKTIKNMSNISIEMLNIFLSYNSKTNLFFSSLADSMIRKEVEREERKREIEDRKSFPQSEKALFNKRFSTIADMINSDMEEQYINYLKNITSKRLKNLYALVMEEKAREYEMSDNEFEAIYESQDEMEPIKCSYDVIEAKLIEQPPKDE